MPTIETENTKALRQSMNVLCGLDENDAKPDEWSSTNCITDHNRLFDDVQVTRLMDLSGDGFLNDGKSMPMSTDPQDTVKYGLITEPAQADGTFENPPELYLKVMIVEAYQSRPSSLLTLELRDSDGVFEYRQVEAEWLRHEDMTDPSFEPFFDTTITLDSWYPGKRCYITKVVLGKAWLFDNSSLISCNLVLRGVETKAENPELQVSEIEIKAYEPNDYTGLIGKMAEGAPIWYQAGYDDDMSDVRRFYLSQKLEWLDKVLTIKGSDATMFLEGSHTGSYVESDTTNSIKDYFDSVEGIAYKGLNEHDIIIDVQGTPPTFNGSTGTNVFLPNKSKRKIIADAMNLFRGEIATFNYRDAGIPQLVYGPITTTWELDDTQIADFKKNVEMNIKKLSMTLNEPSTAAEEEIQTLETISGYDYWIDSSEPVKPNTWRVTGGQILTTYASGWVNCYSIKVRATSSQVVVYGQKINLQAVAKNSPCEVSTFENGISATLEDGLVLNIKRENNPFSASKYELGEMVDRSNISYEFKYRGNPKMQPRDLIELTLGDDTLTMTIDTITLEHSNGGLVSSIVAREGVI